jgi:diguanylate cyclase (GGDEF)-like protein/PAS domain S-box-containing protein
VGSGSTDQLVAEGRPPRIEEPAEPVPAPPDWSDPSWLAALAGELCPDVLVVVDPDGFVRYAGRSVERVFGFTPTEKLGVAIWNVVHPDDLLAAAGAINEATRREGYHHPTEFRVTHAGGGWVECEVNGTTVDGPGGAWMVLSIRATGERDEVMGRRRSLEQLIRRASQECSAVRWNEVGMLVHGLLQELAETVGAEAVEVAWGESEGNLRVGARWPALPAAPGRGADEPFELLWPLGDRTALLRFSANLSELPPSELRDRFCRLGTRAVVELPLSPQAPWGVVRLAFGEGWQQWDDVNIDLVTVLGNTLMASLRRCLAEAHLNEQARSDPLTGLMNRSELYRRFEALLSGRDVGGERSGDGGSIGVLYGDLDRFKGVNDRFGHAVGDRLLLDVADALRASVREVDLVARFGGDEFVIVCPQLESAESLSRLMVRISRAVNAVHAHGEPVRMSLGGAIAAKGVGADEVVRLADEAMYRAKRARNGLQASG